MVNLQTVKTCKAYPCILESALIRILISLDMDHNKCEFFRAERHIEMLDPDDPTRKYLDKKLSKVNVISAKSKKECRNICATALKTLQRILAEGYDPELVRERKKLGL